MAVSRATAEGVGDELRRLFGALEQELAAGVAKRLKAGIDRPDWATKKFAAAGELRRWAEALVKRTAGAGTGAAQARDAVEDAYNRGGQAAEHALAGKHFRSRGTGVRMAIPGVGSINALAAGLGGRLEATGPQVVRSVLDAYRSTVTAGVASVLGGATARRDAAQTVWNKLLDQGFSGLTDVRGRRWSLAGYVDMATRTTTANAAVQGQLDRQADLGLDLVIVSNAPQECPRCRPWEGKILTRDESGRGGKALQVEHATEDRMITIRAAGSVSEAIAAGLMHPNCRHSLSAYLPGLTTAPTHTADPAGNKAREQLRALERDARSARLQETGALTPAGKAAAQARLKNTQAKIREHVKANEHLGIKRKPERERLELGNTRPGRPPTPAPQAPTPKPPAPAAAPTPAPAPAPLPRAIPERIAIPAAGTPERHLAEQVLREQMAIVPKAVDRLGGIRKATKAEVEKVERDIGMSGIAAYYQPGSRELVLGPHTLLPHMERTWKRSVESGWFVKCPESHFGARGALAHEFGHHMDHEVLRRASVHVQQEFWEKVADLLGLPAKDFIENPDPWAAKHVDVIAEKISQYGSRNGRELVAEIWHEYSTNPHPRSHIKILGDMLRAISEETP